MIYMAQPCGTSVEEVHRMTTDAVESSNNAALGAVSVEAVESVSMARIVGKSVRVAGQLLPFCILLLISQGDSSSLS